MQHRSKPLSFNPRAPCGARPIPFVPHSPNLRFQSTRPVRGATERYGADWLAKKFQSTRPVRGATSHSLFTRRFLPCFNPRAPCGARLENWGESDNVKKFQSTRPVRGATHPLGYCRGVLCVSIHAPRAGRDLVEKYLRDDEEVSIHAPRAGRDFHFDTSISQDWSFNPRAPCGARRCENNSIH